jgi:glycosyltransferase involved in cell wall biosynthesis
MASVQQSTEHRGGNDRLRILHLIPSLEGGGAERQVAYLAAAQSRAGHDVHIASVRHGQHARAVTDAGVHHHILKSGGNHDPLLVPRVLALFRELRPDVVQTWLLQMDVLGGLAALTSRSRWVLTERTSGVFYDFPTARVRRWLGARASAIVANSDGGLAYWNGAPQAVLTVIRNGLPLETIRATPVSAEARSLVPLVLFAGRFSEEKNVLTLVEALKRVVPATGARAMLCGEGPQRELIEAAVTAAGLGDSVGVVGYREDLWSWMKAASAFVSLSRFEGCPNTVLEAMACGCPLVVSDIPAHRELLDESCALLVNAAEPDAIAAALKSAITDCDTARRRAEVAAARVQSFSMERVAAAYEALYHRLLHQS